MLLKMKTRWILSVLFSSLLPVAGHGVAITSDFSGSWFNPQTSGQGFQLQVLTPELAGVIWYTFDGNGNQVWAIGVGTITNNQLEAELRIPSGPVFGPEFNSDDLNEEIFGVVNFEFSDCNNANVSWNSDDPQFANW